VCSKAIQLWNVRQKVTLTFEAEARLNIKNPVRTAKKTPHFAITTINWLTAFKEIIAVYRETHMKPVNTACGQSASYLLLK
jgi:hypothetical protein